MTIMLGRISSGNSAWRIHAMTVRLSQLWVKVIGASHSFCRCAMMRLVALRVATGHVAEDFYTTLRPTMGAAAMRLEAALIHVNKVLFATKLWQQAAQFT